MALMAESPRALMLPRGVVQANHTRTRTRTQTPETPIQTRTDAHTHTHPTGVVLGRLLMSFRSYVLASYDTDLHPNQIARSEWAGLGFHLPLT